MPNPYAHGRVSLQSVVDADFSKTSSGTPLLIALFPGIILEALIARLASELLRWPGASLLLS